MGALDRQVLEAVAGFQGVAGQDAGAQAGPVGQALVQGDASRATDAALQLASIFPGRFYIELQRAIVRTVVDMELSPASPELMGTRLGWAQLAGRRLSLAAERDSVKAVTVATVARLCRRLMRPETTALVVMGPSGKDIEKRMKRAIVHGLS